ncbi:MAG: dioxygenase [Rhodobacteraceae bacterium]|nr:MAG: dioxygenase [Paracoccaceae bacterium]
MRSVFHLAYNVRDLDDARVFYGDLLGCAVGRSAETWVDFNFFGHQISLHIGEPFATARTGLVGGLKVPMPHLGVVLPLKDWKALAAKLEAARIDFLLSPSVRFEGEPGEQWTMFFHDPSGNPIEVKGFADFDGLFAS